ncbi:TPA: acyltransferase family protein [Enterobacter ludwigii]|jgi:peptidoglycan/LPS O-acetylase OafA/YrhL
MLEFKTPYSHPNYRPDIDGLRAVAILSVVIFHAFPELLAGGFVGVDIFFVISGYLITTILLTNKDRFSFIEFYARRIKRIFPSLLTVLLVTFIAGWVLLLKSEFLQLNTHITAGSLFYSNFQLLNEINYFDAKSETKPLLHLWSLAIEEQFYIFWPLIIWASFKSKLNPIFVIVIISAWSFYTNITLTYTDKMSAFYLPQSRVWELLAGGALALVALYLKDRKEKYLKPGRLVYLISANIFSACGFGLLAYSFFNITKESAFPGYLAVMPVSGVVLVIAAGQRAILNRAILSNKLAIWFGLISFPLYLWHWPILSFISILTDNGASDTVKIVAVVASVIMSWMTFKFIELPIRGKRGFTAFIPALAVCMIAMSSFSYFISPNLYNHYWESSSKIKLETTASFSPKRKKCHLPPYEGFEKIPACEYFGDTIKKVAVFGNSHATELAYALATDLQGKGIGVKHFTMSGCKIPKITDGRYDKSVCNDWQFFSAEKISQDPDIQYIVVSYRVESYLFEPGYKEGFRMLIDNLSISGKKVFLVMQAPKIEHHINYYIRYSLAGKDVKSGSISQWKRLNKDEYSFIRDLPKTVSVIDPVEEFCDSKDCYAIKDNTSLYFDDNHMSVAGALLVANKIASEINLVSVK